MKALSHHQRRCWRPGQVLTDEEIVRFWYACDRMTHPFGDILKLLLITGCRKNEIAKLQWNEISPDGTQLEIS